MSQAVNTAVEKVLDAYWHRTLPIKIEVSKEEADGVRQILHHRGYLGITVAVDGDIVWAGERQFRSKRVPE